jgi:hypothetical protein
MGTNAAAIAIKIDNRNFDAHSVFTDLIGKDFKEIEKGSTENFSILNFNCYLISYIKNWIFIYSRDLVKDFFNPEKSEIVNRYYEYFNFPQEIFAFEEYEGGDYYGYCLIINGKTRRCVRSSLGNIFFETGESLEVEKRFIEVKGKIGEDNKKVFLNIKSNIEYSESELTQQCLWGLMFEKFGFISATSKFIEDRRFKIPIEGLITDRYLAR